MSTAGRPTKYDPAYCEQVFEAGREGWSLTAFAGSIGVARSSINEWMAEHPEFKAAVDTHKAARAFCWELKLLATADCGGATGQVTAIIFGLKNVAPEEFKDRHEVTGAEGGPIATSLAVQFVRPDPVP